MLLPLLLGFALQATQYARAPIEYDYYIVYAKFADILIKPGTDLSPTTGDFLLQNSTFQDGLYTMRLGRWGPGYVVNYSDAFRIVNREIFDIKMIDLNFTSTSTGDQYLSIWIQNDTDSDSFGDRWVLAWDGSISTLSKNNYILIKSASSYGEDGGNAKVFLKVEIPKNISNVSNIEPELVYNGQISLWFTSIIF